MTIQLKHLSFLLLVALMVILAACGESDDRRLDRNDKNIHPHVFGYSPDGSEVWLGTHHGMYAYDTTEGEWMRVAEAIADQDVMGYEVHTDAPDTIYISGHGFVQRSDDGGQTWKAMENGMPNAPKPDVPDAHLMAQNPNDPQHLFVFLVQEANNVYETLDGGETWNLAGSIPSDTYAIAVGPEGGSTLLVGSESGLRQFAFENGSVIGESAWSTDPTFALLRRADGEVITLGPTGYRRTATGKTWDAINIDLQGENPLGIRESHVDPNRMAVVTNSYSVFESTDGGKTWSKL